MTESTGWPSGMPQSMGPSGDWLWMCRAFELAERGRGQVEPNPLVGAVLVRDNQLVGEGWHERYGGAHAEVNALTAAKDSARGATLYVTLEPCCHYGKTPPCTEALLAAGVRRVVAAMLDPFPRVGGRGFTYLRAQGVVVEFGLGEAAARRLNTPYLKLLSTGRPYVHAKWAMTLDGKLCTRTGDSQWISNETARRRVHSLRGRMDAIIVGIGTVLADDPQLTARPSGPRTAARVVFDSNGRLPLTARLAQTARDIQVLLVTAGALSQERRDELRARGIEVVALLAEGGRPSVIALLDELGRRRMTNVLVEGGAELLGSFFDAGAVDEVHVAVAPHIVGGAAAKSPVGGLGLAKLAEALPLEAWHADIVDGNILLNARLAGR